MPRPGNVYYKCKDCKRSRDDVGGLSKRGLCLDCAEVRMTKSAVQLSARSGPYYEAWRAKMLDVMPSKADRF